MRPTLLLAALALLPEAGLAGGADDIALRVVPRTAAETARIAAVTAPTIDFTAPEPHEALPAGAATVRARTTRDAFSESSANIGFERELDFKLGNGLFTKLWVSAPSSTKASDGLGPFYNARACQLCHLKDGRGHPPEGPDDVATSLFLRVSIPAPDVPPGAPGQIEGYLSTLPDPVYGGQLQTFAVPGHRAESRLGIAYRDIPVALSGGETETLRAPTYTAEDLVYGPLHAGAMLSPRMATPMIGLGLLEAIPEADILAHADPDDADGNGISGRPNEVWSIEAGRPMLGRFGLKAGQPSIREQSAAAFSGDMGISNPLLPAGYGDCTGEEPDCLAAPDGADAAGTEIDAEGLDLVTFYARNLGVPARRGEGDAEVLAGKKVFYDAGCASCHVPKFVTARLEDQPEQSFQLIWPYSDLLLHDMGEGLADHRPEGRASGTEWRTSPLWGIGLTAVVGAPAHYLHDGRARTLLEAILWHGGEAEPARDRVAAMPPPDRAALVAFLESL